MMSVLPRVRVAAAAPAAFRYGVQKMSATVQPAAASAPKCFEELDTDSFADRFVLLRTEEIAERGITVTEYNHEPTGGRVVLIDAPDQNKCFSCNFRTLPKDNTGVPHILEHSVLCGSTRYPSVRSRCSNPRPDRQQDGRAVTSGAVRRSISRGAEGALCRPPERKLENVSECNDRGRQDHVPRRLPECVAPRPLEQAADGAARLPLPQRCCHCYDCCNMRSRPHAVSASRLPRSSRALSTSPLARRQISRTSSTW